MWAIKRLNITYKLNRQVLERNIPEISKRNLSMDIPFSDTQLTRPVYTYTFDEVMAESKGTTYKHHSVEFELNKKPELVQFLPYDCNIYQIPPRLILWIVLSYTIQKKMAVFDGNTVLAMISKGCTQIQQSHCEGWILE
ncbi:hypothetical protein RF11_05332 [Thelohanellus kitauei]|uniref:Uncharacterized protein n=1 Tax=Thelohanellus kitauei TaxID=669202 RepID=A0A0C2JDW2_THEKT|nr:hypothetical protein RF11_05332 [Thelohanellus kitauei]